MNLPEIDTLKNELASLRPLNVAELRRLREEFMVENTCDSNAIEGNTLTLRETALILREGVTIAEKPVSEHLEAIGHRDAFEYMMSLADANAPLAERAIRELHSLVLVNDAKNRGVYRNVPVTVAGAVKTPPPPRLVPELIAALTADYETARRDRHPIEAVSELHLRFEGIHPFIDGNGRVGRLIVNLELIKAGLLPVNIKFADRRKYYDCFVEYDETGRADMLAGLIAGYEAYELERYIAIAKSVKS